MDTDSSKVRLGAVGVVALSLFLALFARLWFLQGIERQEFEAASVSNRLRVVQTEGPRGRILDRNGKVIVDNRTTIVVTLDRDPLREKVSGLDERNPKDLEKVRKKLWDDFELTADALRNLGVPNSKGAPMTAEDIWGRYTDKRYSPQEPVPVAEDVAVEVEQYFMERKAEYPGVVVQRRTVREYPYGPLAAHVLGYVGEINEEELLARGATVPGSDAVPETTTTVPGEDPKPYEAGDSIGKTGVERAYEPYLRGAPGERTIEVNAKGEKLDVVSETPPIAGDDLWLTIDIDVQALAETALTNKVTYLQDTAERHSPPTNAPQGSVVITDPPTGGVTAMASYPTYDPRMVVNGISTDIWNQLQDPASGYPLNNWAIQGGYAPGSTFKPVTAIAGLRTGFIGPGHETFVDRGAYQLQNCNTGKCEFTNARRARHGTVDLARSLTVSSDVYYYWIGEHLWLGRGSYGETPIQDTARNFGLGERTGIDLPGEITGRMPTPENRRKAYEANPEAFITDKWYTGDNLNTAIGQGDVLVTPLQLANMYGTIANGGAVMQPHVGLQVTRAKDGTKAPGAEGNYDVVHKFDPVEVAHVDVPPEQYNEIYQGLVGVTQDPSGTAAGAWGANPTAWPFAGKTGTAEVKDKADTSVFAGWGPAVPGQPPQYATAVIIPESGFGSDVAAPLTFEILAPVSRGQIDPVCPALDPAHTECEQAKFKAYARLDAARRQQEAEAVLGGAASPGPDPGGQAGNAGPGGTR